MESKYLKRKPMTNEKEIYQMISDACTRQHGKRISARSGRKKTTKA